MDDKKTNKKSKAASSSSNLNDLSAVEKAAKFLTPHLMGRYNLSTSVAQGDSTQSNLSSSSQKSFDWKAARSYQIDDFAKPNLLEKQKLNSTIQEVKKTYLKAVKNDGKKLSKDAEKENSDIFKIVFNDYKKVPEARREECFDSVLDFFCDYEESN